MKHVEFCIPTAKEIVPAGPDWIHEVKYDGYRGRLSRGGKDIKLLSRSGLDWWRFPWIIETAQKLRKSRFVIDGEKSSACLVLNWRPPACSASLLLTGKTARYCSEKAAVRFSPIEP
jgi:hypothetical protein